RGSPASRFQVTTEGAGARPDPFSSDHRFCRLAISFPHQASVLDLLRSGGCHSLFSDYRFIEGRLERSSKSIASRRLNPNYSRRLKRLFKAAAVDGTSREPFCSIYQRLRDKGTRGELARLTLCAQDRGARALRLEEGRFI